MAIKYNESLRAAGVTPEIEAALYASRATVGKRAINIILNAGGVDAVRAMSTRDLMKLKQMGKKTLAAFVAAGLRDPLPPPPPRPPLNVFVCATIGRFDFEIEADSEDMGGAAIVTYEVCSFVTGADHEIDRPTGAITVEREDFLAMLKVAQTAGDKS